MGKERRMDCTSPVQEDELSTEGDMQQYRVTGWELRQGLLLREGRGRGKHTACWKHRNQREAVVDDKRG